MLTKFDYKNFYELLELDNANEKEEHLKELIDNYLSQHFFVDDRRWFNTLINKGLINLVYYCERNIPYFTLYDNNQNSKHFSNVSFIWAIQSGSIETLQYVMSHEDFPKFCTHPKLEQEIANALYWYSDRNKSFSHKNFDTMIDMLVEKFPWSIPEILEKLVQNQKNDDITPSLKNFVQKYHPYLKDYLDNSPNENNLTRLCMVSFSYNCLEFGNYLRQQYKDISIQSEFLSFYLLYFPKLETLNHILDNPDFFVLKEENFPAIFKNVFENPLRNKPSKEDYQFYFTVTKNGLHKVTEEEMQTAIRRNMTAFVKRYYKDFKNIDFDLRIENTCTNFIEKQKKEQQYKDYLKKYPKKNIIEKKMKI